MLSSTEIHGTLSVRSDVYLLTQIIEVRDNSLRDPNVRTIARRVRAGIRTGSVDVSARSVSRQMGVIYGRWDRHRTRATGVCVAQVIREFMQFVGTQLVLVV